MVNAGDSTWFGLLSMNRETLDDPAIETFVFSVIVGLSVADTSARAIANLGFEKVLFERPVHIGDTLYAESEVLEIRPSESKPDRGIVYIETRGFNQRRERVLTPPPPLPGPARYSEFMIIPSPLIHLLFT